jgi:hypothetical protein
MAIFGKPVASVISDDLVELLTERAVENVRLEFKSRVPDRDETLKKLSSFGNTFGGYVVIGAQEDGKGRLTGIPGVDPEPGFKQRIVQWCFDAVSPPLTVEVSESIPTPSAPAKVCYVLYVSETDLAPHFLNGRKGVYIRTDEFSQRFEPRLANQDELVQMLNRRKVVLERRAQLIERARGRFRTFTTARYGELGQKKEGIGARFDLSIVPRFPAGEVCALPQLLALLREQRVPWRQVGFPHTKHDLITQHESCLVLGPGASFSLLEANTWGLLFYATEINRHDRDYAGIHLNHFTGHLLVFLQHAAFMIREIGLRGPIEILLRLEGVRDVPWVWFEGNNPRMGPVSPLDDVAELKCSTSTDELMASCEDAATKLLTFVFFALNWPAVAADPSRVRDMIAIGRRFNEFPIPPNT